MTKLFFYHPAGNRRDGNVLATVEVTFSDIPGVRLRGISIRKGDDGVVYVTLPSVERGDRYYHYLRGESASAIKDFKAAILKCYEEWTPKADHLSMPLTLK